MPLISQFYLRDIRYKLMTDGWIFDYEKGWINGKHPGISIRINEDTLTAFVEHEFKNMEEVNGWLDKNPVNNSQ